ncbi:MAG: hypothetical protein J5J00_12730 [Deltaproteobacteria bacterium]|nr:hypothetical protein [Deltaproteobacteria bacterium]
MARRDFENLSFLDALFGLVTQPGETAEVLFQPGVRRHILPFLILFAAVVFGPMLLLAQSNYLAVKSDAISSLALVALFTLFAFVFLEGLMLLIFGLRPAITDLLACAAYTLAPLSAALLILYGFNYLISGNLSMIHMLLGGTMPEGNFSKVLPYALFVISLDMLLVMIFSLRAVGDLHVFTAFCMSILSFVPIYFALLVGVIVAEIAMPGSKHAFFRLLKSPQGVLSLMG